MQLSLLFDDPTLRERQPRPGAQKGEPQKNQNQKNQNRNQNQNQNSEPRNENLENQNPENQNLENQNPENQNLENQNPESQNLENQNLENQNLENQNPENQNPENQNPELRTPNPEPVLSFSRHPRARRYILRVSADGAVRVTIPRWGSRREAQDFARSQRAWIDRQLRKVAADSERPKPPELSCEELRALIARARCELPPRLRELAATHGLTVSRISIRNQRWRWGSCNRSGHICLNWRLVTMPEWVRDYVLIHELMHLKRMDHSRTFWKLVAAACPNYQDARRWLRRASRT
jgi:predicted metal-dependent hydrolase